MNERTDGRTDGRTDAETRLALALLLLFLALGRFDERASDQTANWTQTLQNGRPTWNQTRRMGN